MGAIASQITSLTIVYSTVYSGADQRKHQSSASVAFLRESTGEFPTQRASHGENVSIWRRHHGLINTVNTLDRLIPMGSRARNLLGDEIVSQYCKPRNVNNGHPTPLNLLKHIINASAETDDSSLPSRPRKQHQFWFWILPLKLFTMQWNEETGWIKFQDNISVAPH